MLLSIRMVDTLGKTHQWWIRGRGESPLRKSPMAQHFLIFMLFFFQNFGKIVCWYLSPWRVGAPSYGEYMRVADPGFCQKLHENEYYWTGGHASIVPTTSVTVN